MKCDLYQGDCLEILKTIPDNSIDLIVTDPPYESATNGGGTINKVMKLNDSLQDLVVADIVSGYDIENLGQGFLRVLKTPNIYLWCNKKQITDYFDFYVNKHKCKFEIICWHKSNPLPTYSNKYLSDTEYCLFFHKGKGKTFPKGYEQAKTYYIQPINYQDKKLWKHPTIKPINIIKNLVENSSREGEIVLDPFMGSGTTGVACVRTNRNFIGIEKDEHYFQVAKERIEKEQTENLFVEEEE